MIEKTSDEETANRPASEDAADTLRISVIIPTRNEATTLPKLLEKLRSSDVHEVLVVDGQSSDDTVRLAEDFGARVISSVPGRGHQLNKGVRVSTGDICFFLHADTIPPPQFAQHIRRTLTQPGVCAGAFELSIDGAGIGFRWIERLVKLRCGWQQMPYGDQGIFIRKRDLDRIGGFPRIPIMEDYRLMQLMRKLGRVSIADARVSTSARRWIKNGILRTTLKNRLCVVAYRLGVSPERLARWRNGQP